LTNLLRLLDNKDMFDVNAHGQTWQVVNAKEVASMPEDIRRLRVASRGGKALEEWIPEARRENSQLVLMRLKDPKRSREVHVAVLSSKTPKSCGFELARELQTTGMLTLLEPLRVTLPPPDLGF
jgi:hypothetical protein